MINDGTPFNYRSIENQLQLDRNITRYNLKFEIDE